MKQGNEVTGWLADNNTAADWEAFCEIVEQPVSGDLALYITEDAQNRVLEDRAYDAVLESPDLIREAEYVIKGWDMGIRGMSAETIVSEIRNSYVGGIVAFYMGARFSAPKITRK